MHYFDENCFNNFYGDFRDDFFQEERNNQFSYNDVIDWMDDFERTMNNQTSFNYAF